MLDLLKENRDIKEKFETFAFGSILKSIFSYNDIENNRELTIYLDTNILFQFFGVNNPELKEELINFFEFSRSKGIKIKVLPITAGEFKNSLDFAETGLKKEDLTHIKQNYEHLLLKSHIIIDYYSTQESIKIKLDDTGIKNALDVAGENSRQSESARKHDEVVLHFIKKKSIENCHKTFLLTRHHNMLLAFHTVKNSMFGEKFVFSLDDLYSLLWINSPELTKKLNVIDILKLSLPKKFFEERLMFNIKLKKNIENVTANEKNLSIEDHLFVLLKGPL